MILLMCGSLGRVSFRVNDNHTMAGRMKLCETPWGTNGDDAWPTSSRKSSDDAWLAWSLETLQKTLEQIVLLMIAGLGQK